MLHLHLLKVLLDLRLISFQVLLLLQVRVLLLDGLFQGLEGAEAVLDLGQLLVLLSIKDA